MQVVRSAALAAGCPIAAFLSGGGATMLTIGENFGIEAEDGIDLDGRILSEACRRPVDDPMIANDLTVEPAFDTADAAVFGKNVPPVRFFAACRVQNGNMGMSGLLVVADASPHAGLSPAAMFVLRTHAAQIQALLDLTALRMSHDSGMRSPPPASAKRLHLLESVVVNANDAVLITQGGPIDLPGPRIVYCNAAFTRITGYTEADVLGETPRILQSPETDRAVLDRLRLALVNLQPIEVELFNLRKDGSGFWVELSLVPVADEHGSHTHWVSVQRDVSDRKKFEAAAVKSRIAEAQHQVLAQEIEKRTRIEAQLTYTAFHDDLTKLSNRAYFMGRLTEALRRAEADARFHCAVLFMDLDRFKLVNDGLGHRAGDLLLMEVARRLRGCIRAQDSLARIGGDEFAVLIEESGGGMPAVVAISARIIETMRRAIWLSDQEVFCSVSIGVAQATPPYSGANELMRDADLAMYQAKRKAAGSYVVFAGPMRDRAMHALALQTDLQKAVARSEFSLRYQPICRATTGAITTIEALVRWEHPTRGLVMPQSFIPVAEETGLIRAIGRWVLTEACLQIARLQARLPDRVLRLNVNSSVVELRDPGYVDGLRAALATSGFEPRLLKLEITESIFLQEPKRVAGILDEIRSLGVRIALDDFGTGYSSLGYLDRFKLDAIKLDRIFVNRMLTRPATRAIVDAIVAIGRALQLDIVAEGVETAEQLQAVRDAGCGFVQGYLFGRPMTVDELEATLARQRA